MTKLGAVIQVPFRSGNQFLGEGGLQVRSTHTLGHVCSNVNRCIQCQILTIEAFDCKSLHWIKHGLFILVQHNL